MGERGLGGVLGVDRDALLRAEVGAAQQVGDPVEHVAHLTPAERTVTVVERDLVGAGVGECGGELGHEASSSFVPTTIITKRSIIVVGMQPTLEQFTDEARSWLDEHATPRSDTRGRRECVGRG